MLKFGIGTASARVISSRSACAPIVHTPHENAEHARSLAGCGRTARRALLDQRIIPGVRGRLESRRRCSRYHPSPRHSPRRLLPRPWRRRRHRQPLRQGHRARRWLHNRRPGRLRPHQCAARHRGRCKQLVEQQTGIPAHHVLISATHTHTGPVMARKSARDDMDGGSSEPAQAYKAGLPKLIAQAVGRQRPARPRPRFVRASNGAARFP